MAGSFFSRAGLINSNRSPLFAQRLLEEELDPAQRDRGCRPRVLLDILHVQEILSEFLLTDEVGRL